MSFNSGLPAFPENRAETFSKIADVVYAELSQPESAPFILENVLAQLMQDTTRDMRISLGFHEPKVIVPDGGPKVENPAIAQLHLHPLFGDTAVLAQQLDETKSIAGETSALTDPRNGWNPLYITRFASFLHQRYGRDIRKLANLICFWGEYDIPSPEARDLNAMFEQTPLQQERAALDIMWYYSADGGVNDTQDLGSISGLFGYKAMIKILKEKKPKPFDRAIRGFERLIMKSAKVRNNMPLQIRNFLRRRHLPLAEAIVRQGYRTFANMDRQTEYDLYKKIQDGVIHPNISDDRIADTEFAPEARRSVETATPEFIARVEEFIKNQPKIPLSDVELLPGEPEAVQFLTEEQRDIWRTAQKYLNEHKPEPREKLRDYLKCDQYRAEMKSLREALQWGALGAKEREITSRISSEVMRFPYANAAINGKSYEMMSYRAGTPAFASEHRMLNCFTGPWMMASLCLEAGIPYENMLFCDVHSHVAPHGALLVQFSDGKMQMFDYASKISGETFKVAMIKDKGDAREFLRSLAAGETGASLGKKLPREPVKIEIKKEAREFSSYGEMSLLPLDQGFASSQLLHTGIAFHEEGKLDEALQAYELGLAAHPTSPDLLCRSAMIYLERKDTDRAYHLLETSVRNCFSHLLSHFYLGKLFVEMGNDDFAYPEFKFVRDAQHEPWGDRSFKVKAALFCQNYERLQHLQAEMRSLNREETDQQGSKILTHPEDYLL